MSGTHCKSIVHDYWKNDKKTCLILSDCNYNQTHTDVLHRLHLLYGKSRKDEQIILAEKRFIPPQGLRYLTRGLAFAKTRSEYQ